MADFLPHFQEVVNVSVLLDDIERLLEKSRVKLDELQQIPIPGYTSRLELLRDNLFSQIDHFLNTSQMMLELFDIANCLDAAAIHPDYPAPYAIGYVMFQVVFLYGWTIVRDRVDGHHPLLTALDEDLETFRARVRAQLQSEN